MSDSIVFLIPASEDLKTLKRLVRESRVDLDAVCEDCGAPMGEHQIGGPYHPRPLTPEAQKRESEWSVFVEDCRIYSQKVAFHRAMERARAEVTERG